jgi:hypothetical protein
MTEETKTPPRLTYVSKTEGELEKLAWDVVGGQVFGTWSHPEAAKLSFMVLMFLDNEQRQQMRDAKIVHIYEYIDKAGPRSINGLPSFMSMQLLDETDAEKLRMRVFELDKLKDARLKATAPRKEET